MFQATHNKILTERANSRRAANTRKRLKATRLMKVRRRRYCTAILAGQCGDTCHPRRT